MFFSLKVLPSAIAYRSGATALVLSPNVFFALLPRSHYYLKIQTMPENNSLVRELELALALVPAGKVVSYKQLAGWLGRPNNARLIGRLMARVQAPNWYRVLRSDGSLAFAADSKNYYQQVELLAAEGVLLSNGKVDRQYFFSPQSQGA